MARKASQNSYQSTAEKLVRQFNEFTGRGIVVGQNIGNPAELGMLMLLLHNMDEKFVPYDEFGNPIFMVPFVVGHK